VNFRSITKAIPQFVRYSVLLAVYWTSYIVPKEKNIWVFGAWFGKKFADNSKYLFLYVRKNHPEIRAIWLSRNREVIKTLTKKGHEAYMIHSLRGLFLSCRANCVVICQGLVDVNKYFIAGAKKVQLWHGTPFKKIGSDDILHCQENRTAAGLFLRKLRDKLFPFVTERYSFAIATSGEARWKLASAFRMPKAYVHITGYPRNDALEGSDYASNEVQRWQERIKEHLTDKAVIAYLPTFRDSQRINLLADYAFVEKDVEAFLKKHGAVMWVKAHFAGKPLESLGETGSSRILLLSDEELPDIYPILRETDILITDYSSVYFDYLLLDRPIIFAPFDLEDYIQRDRELYYDYDEVTPGPKAKNWPEVLKLIEQVMEKDEWKESRREISRRFNKFTDGESSRRVFEEIRELLESRYMGKHG